MAKLWALWKSQTAKNRILIQIIVLCVIVGSGAMLYNPVVDKYLDSKKMLSRRLDRISKRTSLDKLEKMSSVPPKVLEQKIADTEKKLAAVKGQFNELDTGFVPEDSSVMRQQLMLEFTTLAERTGVELLKVSRKGFRPEGGTTVLTVDKELGRPLLLVTANATFDQLLQFLKGLPYLSFYVSVMNISLYSRELNSSSLAGRGRNLQGMSGGGYVPVGSIFVSLELSI